MPAPFPTFQSPTLPRAAARAVGGAFAEVVGLPELFHGVLYRRERHDHHRRRKPFTENVGDTRFDILHRVVVLLRQSPADVVQIAAKHGVGVVVEREGLRGDVDVYSLFHNGTVLRGYLKNFNYSVVANIIRLFILCNTKY